MEARSRSFSGSESFAARSIRTLAPSFTEAVSLAAVGASFCGLTVRVTLATLLVTPELALAMAAAGGGGTWSLSVRSFGDDEVVKYDDVRLKEHLEMLEVLQQERQKSLAQP